MALIKTSDGSIGSDPYPGEDLQNKENNEIRDEKPSQDWNPSQNYKFIFINGQFHYSPDKDYEELASNAGAEMDYKGPIALGTIHVFMGKASFQVRTNLDSRTLLKAISYFVESHNLILDKITDMSGNSIIDRKIKSYYYRSGPELQIASNHHYFSSIPTGSIHVMGSNAFVYGLACKDIPALLEWAIDRHLRLRTPRLAGQTDPGNTDNVIKTLEDIEQEDIYTPEWKDIEDHFLTEPPTKEDKPSGPQACGVCGLVFPDYDSWQAHMFYDETPWVENDPSHAAPSPFEHYVEEPDMDDVLPAHFKERYPNEFPYGGPYEASVKSKPLIPFVYNIIDDHLEVGSPNQSVDSIGVAHNQPLIRGTYQGGKIILEASPEQQPNSSIKHILDLWTYSKPTEIYPIKSVHLDNLNGEIDDLDSK